MQRLHICESWRTNRGKVPADYLLSSRVFLPKASVARNWVIRNIRWIQFAIQEEQLTLCWMRGKIKEFLFIKLNLYLSLSFRSQSQQLRQIILCTKNSQEFWASQVHKVLRRNNATNSSTSNRPFLSCTKSSCDFVIYSRFLDLTTHLYEKFATWG